jgi:predicted thioesterase
MKDIFSIGAIQHFERQVSINDIASFNDQAVHQVYATFALGRDAEWCCRLFVLEMIEDDEEGIGTFLHINHHSPALLTEVVHFEAKLASIQKNEIICSYTAKVGERLIASGETGQKILKKEKLKMYFQSFTQLNENDRNK